MIYRFGKYELDTDKVELRTTGRVISLEPQVFAVLALLVENRERLVSKEELVEKVWDGRVVSEAAVSSRIKSARRALGDDGRAQRFIKTIYRQGYRFVAVVRTEAGVDSSASPQDPLAVVAPPERPSIAVLPFRLVGDAGDFAPVAEALPHELITELARLRWLFVTARGSSFRLRAADPIPGPARLGRHRGRSARGSPGVGEMQPDGLAACSDLIALGTTFAVPSPRTAPS